MRLIATTAVLILLLVKCTTTPDKGKEEDGPESGIRVVREYYDSGSLKSEIQAKGKLRHGITTMYSESGIKVSTISYEDNMRHGKSVTYYTDGSISSVIRYEYGFRHGDAEKYYKNGKIYRITPYLRGAKNGICKTFWEDGIIQSELPYKDGEEGAGLKEYTREGELKKMEARILVKEIDEIAFGNKFTLQLSLSDGSANVEFFKGTLTDGQYWNRLLAPVKTENGRASLMFYLPRGSFVMETIHIVARKKTSLDNHYILHREYHLAAENKFIP